MTLGQASGMPIDVSVSDPDDYASLIDWLKSDDETRRLSSSTRSATADEQMGASEILTIILDSGGLAAILGAIHTWIKYRQPSVKVKLRRRRVALLRSTLRMLATLRKSLKHWAWIVNEPPSLGFDPELARIILVGTSRFPKDPENLPNIPGVVCNVVDFERLLLDTALTGIPTKNVTRLLDEPSITTIQEAVADACSEAQDLLLFYYTGHGLISKKGGLLLTVPGSTLVNSSANCVHWATLKEFVLSSPATNKLIVLDCCFSGRALDFMGPDDEVIRESLNTKGAVVLTSSARTEPSLAPAGERRTAFTGALLQLLEDGLDNGRPVISVNEAFAGAQQAVTSRGFPEPRSVASDNATDLNLARNCKTLGADASTIAASESIFRNLERQIGNYIESRLPEQARPTDEDVDAAIPRTQLWGVMFPTLVFCVVEATFILFLGAHRSSSYVNSGKPVYPRLIGFLIIVIALFLVSVLLTAAGVLSHRKPWRQTALSIVLPHRGWVRWVTVLSMLNAALVLVVSVIAVSVEVFYVST